MTAPSKAQIEAAAKAIFNIECSLGRNMSCRIEFYEDHAKAALTAVLDAGYVIITREEYDRINN